MSYVRLNINKLGEARERVRRTLLEKDQSVAAIRGKMKICQATARRTRKLFAVDSGFSSAYETPFVVFKGAVVSEDMKTSKNSDIYLFHVDNYQTDRLKRLLMQQTMYKVLAETVETGAANGAIVLVDGTITLSIFHPTSKDSKEYRQHFKELFEELYSPLLSQCFKRDIVLLGFLKRTGSSYLGEYLGSKGLHDFYIMYSTLKDNGQYIEPIPMAESQLRSASTRFRYVTFYLNLKNWSYRFELAQQQESKFLECIENLLFWATETHCGMNPIFSKADEHSRVTKRAANLMFNHIIQSLPIKEQTRLRIMARKRTHFGYRQRGIFERAILR